MENALIEVRDLFKSFPAKPEPIKAVQGLSLKIPKGVCFGF